MRPELNTLSACPKCARVYPPSLIKATHHSFSYVLRLRDGSKFCFKSATIHGNFATLEEPIDFNKPEHKALAFHRGIDVRISDIVWCANAPWDEDELKPAAQTARSSVPGKRRGPHVR